MDSKELMKFLDFNGSPSVFLQSIHIIDIKNKNTVAVCVSSSKITGKIQSAIQEAINEFVKEKKNELTPSLANVGGRNID